MRIIRTFFLIIAFGGVAALGSQPSHEEILSEWLEEKVDSTQNYDKKWQNSSLSASKALIFLLHNTQKNKVLQQKREALIHQLLLQVPEILPALVSLAGEKNNLELAFSASAFLNKLDSVHPQAIKNLIPYLSAKNYSSQSYAQTALRQIEKQSLFILIPYLKTASHLEKEAILTFLEKAQQIPLSLAKPFLIPLIEAKETKEQAIGDKALRTLACLSPFPQEIETLVLSKLNSSEESTQSAAIFVLGAQKASSLVTLESLVKKLLESHLSLDNEIGQALRKIGEPTVPHLRNLLQKPQVPDSALILACFCLGNICPPGTDLPELKPHLYSPSAQVRAAVAWVFGQIKSLDIPTSDKLIKMLADPDKQVRNNAIFALVQAPLTLSFSLEKALQDKNSLRVANASIVWAKRSENSEKGLSQIKEMLHSQNPLLLSAALQAITILGPQAEPLIPSLLPLIEVETNEISLQAVRASIELGKLVVPSLSKRFLELSDPLQERILFIFHQLGKKAEDAIPVLLNSISHPNPLIRQRSIEVLGEMDILALPAAVLLGERLEKDNEWRVRHRAFSVLRRIYPWEKELIRPFLERAQKTEENTSLRHLIDDFLSKNS